MKPLNADVFEKPEMADGEITSLANLAQQQLSLEKEIAAAEEALDAKKEKLRVLQEQTIPEKMMGMGMESFKLSDGSKVEIKKFYAASILSPDECFAWLRSQGHGSIIKREIKSKFGMGEDAEAQRLLKLLEENMFTAEDKSTVHPATLKAFVREQLEAAKTIPSNLMSVHVGNRSKVTLAK